MDKGYWRLEDHIWTGPLQPGPNRCDCGEVIWNTVLGVICKADDERYAWATRTVAQAITEDRLRK